MPISEYWDYFRYKKRTQPDITKQEIIDAWNILGGQNEKHTEWQSLRTQGHIPGPAPAQPGAQGGSVIGATGVGQVGNTGAVVGAGQGGNVGGVVGTGQGGLAGQIATGAGGGGVNHGAGGAGGTNLGTGDNIPTLNASVTATSGLASLEPQALPDAEQADADLAYDWDDAERAPTDERERRDYLLWSNHDDILGGQWHVGGRIGRGRNTTGIWLRFDDEDKIMDRVVVKDTYLNPAQWADIRKWQVRDPKRGVMRPMEYGIQRKLRSTRDHRHFAGVRKCKVFAKRRMYRLYTDYCSYGNGATLIEGYTHHKRQLPEDFLWCLLLALADAALVMEQGSSAFQSTAGNKPSIVISSQTT
ncbi:hypothetical protein LTR86_007192 [Recurvomyces mirabilis]|nr:hypothetical protein LTR86_007192 [Recurvomyces mirabilis]